MTSANVGGDNPLKGTCRYCRCKVWLKDDAWLHDGIGALVHIIKKHRKASNQ